MLEKFDIIIEKLEFDSKIIDFKFTKSQIPMYLVIRFTLIQLLINKEFNLSNPHTKANKKSLKVILEYIYNTIKSNLFFAPKKDIYIFSSDMLNVLEAGKYKNRLHNNFCKSACEKIQLFESSHDFQYKEPKHVKVYFIDFILILRKIFSFLMKKNDKDSVNIELLIEYINVKIGLDSIVKQQLNDILQKYSKMVNIEFFLYDLFIKIKRPKILIVDCVYYGVYIPLILAAKKYDVETIEYQHGYVGLAHPAYNYSNSLFDKISKYFPRYFYTYGKYWSDRVRIPSEKIEIGLYELESNLELSQSIEKEKSILFISSGTIYKELNFLVDSVINKFQELEYKVILRVHPSEKSALNQRYGNLLAKGLIIDNLPLYERLAKTEIVIGIEVSTVLFEAVCFTSKVYMQNTQYTRFYEPKPMFVLFENANQLCTLVKENVSFAFEKNYWWSLNSALNYNALIEKLLKRK